jgi:hypothetical protein
LPGSSTQRPRREGPGTPEQPKSLALDLAQASWAEEITTDNEVACAAARILVLMTSALPVRPQRPERYVVLVVALSDFQRHEVEARLPSLPRIA